MLRFATITIFVLGSFFSSVPGQSISPDVTSRPNIDSYINGAWETLTRSTDECRAFTDVKVSGPPVLFVPFELPVSDSLKRLGRQCNITVQHLPQRIQNLGDIRVSSLPQNGLLYLPRPYVVPGGRFNEMYGWDSYFIELGLLAGGRTALARDILDDFFFEVEHYGGVLNANRTYYLSRSQPPFLATMVLDFYRSAKANDPKAMPDSQWLAHGYEIASRAYSLWTSPKHRIGNTGLARYADFEGGPVPEMADDDDYYAKVIGWLQQHPNEQNGYLVARDGRSRPKRRGHDPGSTCASNPSRICNQLHMGDAWLSRDFFRGDRADRESGFDSTFRFGPFAGSTHHYAPVCLNSLLFRYEADMAKIAALLDRSDDVVLWKKRADRRRKAINQYLWNASLGRYVDYDFVAGKQSSYLFATTFYPLWAGVASTDQAAALARNLPLLEQAHGVAMSRTQSGLQWDFPYGWAPCNWIIIDGLSNYGYREDAVRVGRKFDEMVADNYAIEGTIREKYNVVTGSTVTTLQNGYSANVIGFGWSNGVYLMIQRLLKGEQSSGNFSAPPAP